MIKKIFNKNLELVSISDDKKLYSPKSKKGKELMNLIIDPMTHNSTKKYIVIEKGYYYTIFKKI